jgi:hypothetical protein
MNVMYAEDVLAIIRRQSRRILSRKLAAHRLRLAATELADAAKDLDERLSRGGALPISWQTDDGRPPGD